MSSTFTVGKLAAAVPIADGQAYYILFEQTYESNVSPRTPRWSCIYFGTVAGALRQIFGRASSAEGGMLRNRADNLTPESYVASWVKQLAAPVGYCTHGVQLCRGKSFYAPINDENADAARATLEAHDRPDLARKLDELASVELDVYRDAKLLAALVEDGGVSPWRLITGPGRALRIPSERLGYRPPPARNAEVTTPAFRSVDGEHVLMQRSDGTWYQAGWQGRVVANYIADLWELELTEPGAYRRRIQAYRAAVAGAPKIPQARVVVNLAVPLEDWQSRTVFDVRENIATVATPNGFEFEVALDDRESVWQACRLPQACTTWVIPDDLKLPRGPAAQEQLLPFEA